MLKKSLSSMKNYPKRFLSLQSSRGNEWTKHEKIVMEPLEYTLKLPIKHYKMLLPAFNHWLKVPEDKLKHIEEATQILAAWVIISDDIQDNSAFRYGVPSAHSVFGMGLTINAMFNALLIGGKQTNELGHPLAFKVFLKRTEEYTFGQGIDIYWRDNNIWPTEEEHMYMIKNKLGSTSAFPVELMQLFSSDERDYTELATNFGIYYAVLDDYYNLFQPKGLERLPAIKQENYTACSDITECKPTLPFIHAMQFPDVACELTDILKQRTNDPKMQNRVLWLLKKHGSDEYMRNKLRELEVDVRNQIVQLGGNAKLSTIMDDLSY